MPIALRTFLATLPTQRCFHSAFNRFFTTCPTAAMPTVSRTQGLSYTRSVSLSLSLSGAKLPPVTVLCYFSSLPNLSPKLENTTSLLCQPVGKKGKRSLCDKDLTTPKFSSPTWRRELTHVITARHAQTSTPDDGQWGDKSVEAVQSLGGKILARL